VTATLPTLAPDTATAADFAAVRERSWIARSDRGFEVLRYDEGVKVLQDDHLSKGASFRWRLDELGITDDPIRKVWDRMLVTQEAGEHRSRLRAPIARVLGPRQIRPMRGVARAIADRVLDEVADPSRVDFMDEACWRIPAQMFCAMMAAPLTAEKQVAGLSDRALSPLLTVEVSRRQESIDAFVETAEFVRTHLEAKRAHLGDDFASQLIREQESGALSEDELIETGIALVQASIDNTVHQLGLTLGTLLEEPARWRLLRERPELVPQAVNEVVRFRPRFGTIFRIAHEELDLMGVEIPAGSAIFVSVRTAQRDPRAYADPEDFDMERRPSRPVLMFGNGAWNCLGQFLARMEVEELLGALLERYPDVALAAPWTYRETNAVTEVTRLEGSLAG
jgi:cytochrome P450